MVNTVGELVGVILSLELSRGKFNYVIPVTILAMLKLESSTVMKSMQMFPKVKISGLLSVLSKDAATWPAWAAAILYP
jgi:hypothetical protein